MGVLGSRERGWTEKSSEKNGRLLLHFQAHGNGENIKILRLISVYSFWKTILLFNSFILHIKMVFLDYKILQTKCLGC